MRILIVNSMFANALYRRCADELGKLPDVELTMLTVDGWRMNGRPMPFEELQVDAPYRTIIGRAGWKGYENRGFYKSGLIEAFRQSKPDVLFLMEEPFSVFALEILALKKVLSPETPVVFFTWNNLSLHTFDYRPSIFYRTVARVTLSRMHYALTANTDGHEVLREAGFKRPIQTVGYGVDTAAYAHVDPTRVAQIRRELGYTPEDTVIGYVGRLLHMKGIDLLIEAFAAEVSRDPSRALQLLLIGGGEAESALIEQAERAGVRDRLKLVPTVPHGEVALYMHALDILTLPSRRVGMWAEQFGRVLVEAMAAGKIVIGSSSGAIPEVIGEAGLVFEENNAIDLQTKLHKALSLDDTAREHLASAARARAANVYSWEAFAQRAYDAICYVYENHRVT